MLRQLLLCVVLFVAGCGGDNQKYAIEWRDPSLSPIAVGMDHREFAKGKPRVHGDTVVYTDWTTGATMTVSGRNFTIRKIDD